MPRLPRLAGLCLFLGAAGCASNARVDLDRVIREATREELVPFDSESELRSYAKNLADAQRRLHEQYAQPGLATPDAQPSPAPEPAAMESSAEGEESVTNVQEAGVDEGGIVKTHGDHLVVLRRGRLFSIDLADEQRRPVSMVDVPPPGGGSGTWYDEMLIHDGTIVVVGYSYDQGGTELDLFDIDGEGHISRRSTHYLRSNDYYSSRNYASRLIGDQLVFYMPVMLFDMYGGEEAQITLPAERRSAKSNWHDISLATEVYRPIQKTDAPVLHTVVSCDLSQRKLGCSARGVIGPYGRNFYVSGNAVYVWVSGGHSLDDPSESIDQSKAVVYRLPLDGSTPGALRVFGVPTDQFSFKEQDDNLHVLVRAEGGGEWMWSPEAVSGDVALLSVPIEGIGTNVGTVRAAAYTKLPRPGEGYAFQNRFVGDYVLYGSGESWGTPERKSAGSLFAHPFKSGGSTAAIALEHGVDRIEALGGDAMIVGSDGENLHFTSVALGGAPKRASHFVQQAASQGELRSHGFFFKPSGTQDGVLGLPVRGQGAAGAEHLVNGSASVLFLQVDDLALTQIGGLAAKSAESEDDQCIASCVDWYGNARPLFYRGRVFALLGYELVEGRIDDGRIREIGRTHFLQQPKKARIATEG
jgi:hypothetical protein